MAEWHVYAWPILWLGSLGATQTLIIFRAAGRGSRRDPSVLYLGAVGVLAAVGCTVARWSWFLPPSAMLGVLGMLAGAALLPVVLWADNRLARRLFYLVSRRATVAAPGSRLSVRPAGTAAGTMREAKRARPAAAASGLRWPVMVAVALAEEVLYRGVFVGLGREQAGVAGVAVIVLSSVIFLYNHLQYGFHQVLAKIPLLGATLTITLLFASPIGAMVLHGGFNAVLVRRINERGTAPA